VRNVRGHGVQQKRVQAFALAGRLPFSTISDRVRPLNGDGNQGIQLLRATARKHRPEMPTLPRRVFPDGGVEANAAAFLVDLQISSEPIAFMESARAAGG